MDNEKENEIVNETKNDEKIEEILNDKYKDYHTSPFEPMKRANPRILIGVGIIAIILAVVIIVVFGGAKKADAKVSGDVGALRYHLTDDDDDYDDGYDDYDDDDGYDDDDYDDYDDDEYYDITKYPYRNITLYNGMNVTEKSYGDPEDYDEDDFSPNYFYYGDQGRITFSYSDDDDYDDYYDDYDDVSAPPGRSKNLGYDYCEGEEIHYSVDNPSVVTIDSKEHTYRIVGGGKATVTATCGSKTASYTIISSYDISSAQLEKNEATVYMMDEYASGVAAIKFAGDPNLTYSSAAIGKTTGSIEISRVKVDSKNKELQIRVYDSGEGDVVVYVNGIPFAIHIVCKVVNINVKTRVLDKGKSFSIKLKNYPGSPSWKSSNTKIASVTGSGKVKGKKIGNAIIYADIDGSRVGCIVSVVKKGVTKACARATFIGTHWKYSQPKRMKKGYYDCSALVWKSYKYGGIYVAGAKSYAPTAAELGKWCVKHKRKVGKFNYNNINKLKYLPGDCLFLTGAKNGRYKGISHVEMITGYYLYGFSDGKPSVDLTWGARGIGYGGGNNDIVGRPVC